MGHGLFSYVLFCCAFEALCDTVLSIQFIRIRHRLHRLKDLSKQILELPSELFSALSDDFSVTACCKVLVLEFLLYGLDIHILAAV